MRIVSKKASGGFTLTEIMIVVAIIGLLASIIAPRALRARDQACIQTIRSNLRVIEESKQQWAIVRGAHSGTLPPTEEIVVYLRGEQLPSPVMGETYHINELGVVASATLSGALLDLPAGAEIMID